MKEILKSPSRSALLLALVNLSLICFYCAIAIGNSGGNRRNTDAVAQTIDREANEDRERLDRFVSPISPDDLAKARAAMRALPPSPLAQSRQFGSPDDPSPTPAPFWKNPFSSTIVASTGDQNPISGRIDAFAFDSTDPDIIYAGGYGGLLRTKNGGATWKYLSDSWDSQTVSSITLDPLDQTQGTIYAGTGLVDHRGVGLYRSTTGGETWDHIPGPFSGSVITGIVADPNTTADHATLYVANDRLATEGGLWSSADRGNSWTLVQSEPCASPAPTVGCNGVFRVAIDSSTTPSTIYIADAEGVKRKGPREEIFTTIYPGNECWGSPDMWKINMQVVNSVLFILSPTSGSTPPGPGVCTDVEVKLFMTESPHKDEPEWTLIPTLCPRPSGGPCPGGPEDPPPWQGKQIKPERFAVDPSDPTSIFIGNVKVWHTTLSDPGNPIWEDVQPSRFHDDPRAIAFSPNSPGRAYVGNDGGIWRSPIAGAGSSMWENLNQNLPVMLLNSIALSHGRMVGGTFDNGTIWYDLANPDGYWRILNGGDAFTTLIDPIDTQYSYYRNNSSGAALRRHVLTTLEDEPIAPLTECGDVRWTKTSSAPHSLILPCHYSVYRTSNATTSRPLQWQEIPLPTPTASPGALVSWLGTAAEAPNNSEVIYAAEYSPANIWRTGNAPSSGGLATWTRGIIDAPCTHINAIAVDPTNWETAYLACSEGIFRTKANDGGHWQLMTTGALANANYKDVIIDSRNTLTTNTIYAASDAGVITSPNQGKTWQSLTGIPPGLSISSLWFDANIDPNAPGSRQLVASSEGRGVYVHDFDDILPSISITSPAENTIVTGLVTITADASDNHAIKDVQFKVGTHTLGPILTTPPFVAVWDSRLLSESEPPNQTLAAVAHDLTGNESVSSVGVTVLRVSLPIGSLSTSVSTSTVVLKPVTTTFIDESLQYTQFESYFSFDSSIITFAFPYAQTTELTSTGWALTTGLSGTAGGIRTLYIHGTSNDQTPLSGSGTLFNLRMRRVSGTPGAATPLTWLASPNDFEFSDGVTASPPNQINGLITISP